MTSRPPTIAPRTRAYDGGLYARVIDPMLAALHRVVGRQVPDGARVLDVGCGTGWFALSLAPRCAAVHGVDVSPAMIAWAEQERRRRGVANASFGLADAARLESVADASFDVATVVLALHEMPHATRVAVLAEAGRAAARVLAVDFAAPMPWNLAGLRNRALEIAAGREHLAAFRDYQRRGGLPALAAEAGLAVVSRRAIDARTTLCTWMAATAPRA